MIEYVNSDLSYLSGFKCQIENICSVNFLFVFSVFSGDKIDSVLVANQMRQTVDQFIGSLGVVFLPKSSGIAVNLATKMPKRNRPNNNSKIIAMCLIGLSASGCVGANVNNSLDVAALESPQDVATQTLDQAAPSVEGSDVLVSSIPVPAPSPVSSQTALIADAPQNHAVAAAEQAIVENPQATSIADVEPASQTAALQTQNSQEAPQITVVRPVVPQQASVTRRKPKKPGGLFGLFFGKKPAPKQTASIGVKPKSKTTVTAPPSRQALNGALPGVKRNSAIFGISDGTKDADANVQVASVGAGGRLMSPGGLVLQTERVQVSCFKPELMRILAGVERKYGKKVIVTSGYRSPRGNRRAGGARNSTHIYCKAADIQVEGVSKWDLAKYLRSVQGRGGVGTYCRTRSVHIDVGTQRDWHHPCRRSKKRKKA